ncbi:uncharacterized protein LOC110678699 isoform X2 [Aedes aegypti]|uniref:Uncharacterized protein n=1 Tax=Aedes aegypti TaxID=7159 RepID=A0A6I8TNZ1_AEDAE|nr:uncharacterized protein LOC110678699 isoform X2 [Aedes aegypti]
MLSDIVDVINTACCKAITPGCKTASTLHQLSAKVFTKEVNKICQYGVRISVLHDLPTTVLSSVLDHMTYFPSLRRKLHQELSDPVLFMKGFASHETDRLKLENCLRHASLIGKPVLPELAKNWCKRLMEIKQPIGFSSILNKVVKTITFGAYLHEAGWVFQSMEVLDIALLMISQAKENKNHEALEMICVKHKLRAEGSALLRTKADTTCSILLTMIENTTDSEDLLKVYLEVANHNFKAHRIAESHHWTRRAMELMTESTSDDSIIEILQLESVYLFHSQRHEAGTLIISQAIHRAKITFGYLNRRFAGTPGSYQQGLRKVYTTCRDHPKLLGIWILPTVTNIRTVRCGIRPHSAGNHACKATDARTTRDYQPFGRDTSDDNERTRRYTGCY